MSLPLAAVGALLAALLETSVLPLMEVAGAKPDLVFVLAIVAAMMVGVEDGLVWAALGGLALDMLVDRPIGATMLTLLIVAGLGIVVARVLGPTRITVTVLTVFALTWVFQTVILVVLAVTSGVAIPAAPLPEFLPIAVFNAAIAVVAALVTRWALLRFGPADRIDW